MQSFGGRNALNINVEVQVSILSMKNAILAHVSIQFKTSLRDPP